VTVPPGCVYFPGGGVAYFAGPAQCDPTGACEQPWIYVKVVAGGAGVGSFTAVFTPANTCPNASNLGIDDSGQTETVDTGTFTVTP
jgi:hypothetical protein